MTNKLTQVTENDEDVLSSIEEGEQTIGGMTDDMTEDSFTQPQNNKKKSSGGKGGNKTAYIVVGLAVVVATTAAFAYFTMFKKEAPKPAKPVAVKKAPAAEAPPVAPVTPMASVDNGFPSDSQESKTAADFLNRDLPAVSIINEVATEVVPATQVAQNQVPALPVNPVLSGFDSAPAAPVVPVQQSPLTGFETAPVMPVAQLTDNVNLAVPVIPSAPVVPAAPVVPVTPVVPLNPVEAPKVVHDTSINSAFDAMATRVEDLEKFKVSQENWNEAMEKRVVRLEGFHEGQDGKGNKAATAKKSSGTVAPAKKVTTSNVKKTTAKPKYANSGNKPAARKSIEGELMVDKTGRQPAPKAAPLEEYNFHSIYDGRAWLKIADGSLITFTEGARLPNGEVVIKIDHEKFEVVTNKRTIRKK